jgi:chromosome segregation ATPase
MADTNTDASAGDTYSKEYVEKLKADAARNESEMAQLRAFKAGHDEQQRKIVTQLQPEAKKFMGVLTENFPDHVAQMEGISTFTGNAHESNSLDTAVSLTRTIACASALYEKTREEASQLKEQAGSLGETMKKVEELETDIGHKKQRISELEALCNERQANNEEMQAALAKAGIIKEKMDFSKTTSREAVTAPGHTTAADTVAATMKTDAAPLGTSSEPSSAAAPTLQAVTVNASRRIEDDLMSYVSNKANGGGSHRINQSGTAHAHLGATAGSMDDEISAAIRGHSF